MNSINYFCIHLTMNNEYPQIANAYVWQSLINNDVGMLYKNLWSLDESDINIIILTIVKNSAECKRFETIE